MRKPVHRWSGAIVVAAVAAVVTFAPPVASNPTRAAEGEVVAAAQSGWGATAIEFRGKNGSRFVYSCPARGSARTVWGTDVYTDDSSVCTAAVHAGRIGFARGGAVTIEIRPGLRSYRASARNGVTTRPYGAWPGSFVVVAATPQPAVSAWTVTATQFRGRNGARFNFTCPAGGPLGPVWGTDVYTDDSSICTAAVHAGRIIRTRGGTGAIEIRPGLASYRGLSRNGVASRPYGRWPGSFVFVDRAVVPPATTTTTTVTPGVEFGGDSWAAAAQNLRHRVGSRFRYTCPAGGPARTSWGTDVYTDDSSVCTAAVHAGRITVAGGGTVVIEIRPGQASYVGSTRNGITSDSYGAWGGSFVFV